MATTLPKRAVRCAVHGLHYDPELTGGCARCRREGLIQRERPQFLPLLLLLLALTLVAARLVTAILADRAAPPTEDGPVIVSQSVDQRIDPDRHRDTITRIEQALYPASLRDLSALRADARSAASILAADLRRDGASVAAAEIERWSETLAADGADADRLRAAQDAWLHVRPQTFLPAPWLATGTPATTQDPTLLADYLELTDAIDFAIRGIPDTASADWSERVRALTDRPLVAPPYQADARLVLGHEALAPGPGGPGPGHDIRDPGRQSRRDPGPFGTRQEPAHRALARTSHPFRSETLRALSMQGFRRPRATWA